jgi:hypothetical protein
MIRGILKRGDKSLQKGFIDRIDVIWEDGINILNIINIDYTLYVIASKETITWIRKAMEGSRI